MDLGASTCMHAILFINPLALPFAILKPGSRPFRVPENLPTRSRSNSGAQRLPQAVLGHDHWQEEKLHSVSVRAKLLERPKKVSRMFSHHYCGHYDARWRGRRTRYQFDPLNKNDLYQKWPKSRRLTGISIYLLAVSIMHLRGYFG